jgi:hypothetical protein
MESRADVRCRTRMGPAACTNVLRRALVARFLPLDFVQTASPILIRNERAPKHYPPRNCRHDIAPR